jgi:hypothetical protein
MVAIFGPLLLLAVKTAGAVKTIGTAFGLIPKAAAPAIATTDAELATLGATAERTALQAGAAGGAVAGEVGAIGGAAVAAESKVALLSRSLGLLGAITIAPIVGQVAAIATNKYGGGAKGGTETIDNGDGTVTTYKVDPGTGFISTTSIKRGSIPLVQGGAGGVGEHGALAKQHYAGPTTGTGHGGNGAVGSFKPSRAGKLNLALEKNPNDVSAIKAKLAYDSEAAAFAEKLIASGKVSKKRGAQLVQELGQIYSDENQLNAQLQQIATAAVDAHKKRAEAAKKARETILKQRQKHLDSLTTVPVALQLEEQTAKAHSASAQKLVAIYEKEKRALEQQIAVLEKIGASKKEILKARKNEAAVQAKIDAATKTKSAGNGDFFTEAANEYALYGSDIAGPNGILSGQDARAKLAEIALHLSKIARSSASTEKHTGALKRNRTRDIDLVSDAATHGY